MEAQGGEAVCVGLGALVGRPQTQLEGFKSRELRVAAPLQSHMYSTAWRAVNMMIGEDVSLAVLAIGENRQAARKLQNWGETTETPALCHGTCPSVTVVVMTPRPSLAHLPSMLATCALVQTQASSDIQDEAVLALRFSSDSVAI